MTKHIVFDCDGTLLDTSRANYQLYPGIKDLILELAPLGKLYVWTARDRSSTLRILKELGILQFFEDICTVDDAFSKPHAEGLNKLVGKAPKSSVCVIGDTSNDVFGAKNYGVLSIGAIWNSEAREEYLRKAGADFIVSHPLDCSKLIQQNLKGENHV